MKTLIFLRVAAVFPLFIISLFSQLFLFSACDKALPQQPPQPLQPPTPPQTPIESGRDLWNRLEKEDPDKLIDYDFTDEQIEQIKRDFRIERGSDPSLPEKKIDLNGNLLFFRGIVFSGVISVRQGGEYLYLNDYRFNIAIFNWPPITEKRIMKGNDVKKSAKNNRCHQITLALESDVFNAMQEVDKNSFLPLPDQRKLLKGLLKKINAKFDDIEVNKEDIVICYEKLPCITRTCDTMEKAIHSNIKGERSVNSDSIKQEPNTSTAYQWQAFQERDFNNPEKSLFIFDSGLQVSPCYPDKGKELLEQLNDLIISSASFDKYFLLALSIKMKECIFPLSRVEYIFSNPEYFSASVNQSFRNEK